MPILRLSLRPGIRTSGKLERHTVVFDISTWAFRGSFGVLKNIYFGTTGVVDSYCLLKFGHAGDS